MIFFTILFLAFMEVSLSFDNAILNAGVLRTMSKVWQRRFLTWGMPIAVFGMRLAFPILIVCLVSSLSPTEAIKLSIRAPEQYATILSSAHVAIDGFGGMFLLMIFLKFLFEEKEHYWLGKPEKWLAYLGRFEILEVLICFALIITLQAHQPGKLFLEYGAIGILLNVFLNFFMGDHTTLRSGFGTFLYLEVLDASCSFDGVIGAFVLTNNIFYIMLGLGIGAFAVRWLTLYLVRGGALKEYIYLEHGAHYAIGALAGIMLADIFYNIPEPVTGMIGISLIGLSLLSSIRKKI